MSKRKFFGALVPGFVIVILLGLEFNARVLAIIYEYQLFHDRYFIYATVLVLSYLLGLISLQIAFRLLDILCGGMDKACTLIKNNGLRKIIGFCSDRFHIFNLCTLADETKKYFGDGGAKEGYADPYWTAKMAMIKSSPILAKEAMEIEGDINFYAGMFLPLIWFAVLVRSSWPLTVVSIIVAIFFALRFQHLRHDDIAFVANAANSITPR